MSQNWSIWCRLCARTPSDKAFQDISSGDLIEIIRRCFHISNLDSVNDIPAKVCPDCVEFLGKVKSFDEVCSRSEKLFKELISRTNKGAEVDMYSLRGSYMNEDEDDVPLISRVKIQPEIVASPRKRGRPRKVAVIKVSPSPKRRRSSESKPELSAYLEVEIKNEDFGESDGENVANLEANILDSSDDEINSNRDMDSPFEPEDDEEGNGEKDDDETGEGKKTKRRGRRKSNIFFEGTLREHLRCPDCVKVLKNKRSYMTHMRLKHGSEPNVSLECHLCPKKFATKKTLASHQEVHLPEDQRQRFPCPYCDKTLTKPYNVLLHIRSVHIGLRPYVCEECGKTFATIMGLKEHQIIHSDDRPFQCTQCPKRFKTQPSLKLHMDIHNETEYICPHCGLRLNTRRTLNMHMVVHSDEKKYKCQYCGNEYKRAKALKNHLILHTGMHPYSCPFCQKTFANGSNFRTHKRKSHPEQLAAMEASGQDIRSTSLPSLNQLQPKLPKKEPLKPGSSMASTEAIDVEVPPAIQEISA